MPRTHQQFADLLSKLVGDDAPETLRLLAHALLNTADDLGHHSLERLRTALPWLQAALKDTPEQKRKALSQHPGVRVLNEHALASLEGDDAAHSIAELAELDCALGEIADTEDSDDIRSRLLADTKLLGAALDVSRSSELPTKTPARRISDALPLDDLPDADIARNRRALRVLADLESENPGALGASHALSDRARRFEESLVKNAGEQDVIRAVRVALAIGSPTSHTSDTLYSFDTFRRQPELAALARALIEMRGLTHGHLRGSVPLRRLSHWPRFLRNNCSRFAEAREISQKEAASWAHFCLHLMNVCDIVADDGELTDATRNSIKGVEDELKEFSMAGRRKSGPRRPEGSMSNLGQYDRMRWRPRGSVAYLADRTARLAGAWREPVDRTPIGSPPHLTSNLQDRAEALWAKHLQEGGNDNTARRFVEALQHCDLKNAEWLDDLDIEFVARLLAFGYRCARDLPGVSIGSSFRLDMGGLAPRNDRAGDLQTLEALLSRHSLDELLRDEAQPPGHALGVVAAFDQSTSDDRPTIALQLELNGELRALLQLLDEDHDQQKQADPDLHNHIQRRIDELLNQQSGGVREDSPAVSSTDTLRADRGRH